MDLSQFGDNVIVIPVPMGLIRPKSLIAEGKKGLVRGVYTAALYESEGGKLLWEDEFHNVVCTLGKNAAWDNFLAGSSYTVTGPFMGLISSASFSAVAAGDTMASHSGWLEAGSANAPTYSGTRGSTSWASASGGSKSLSGPVSFTFTGPGTVQGAFMVLGSGAVNTIGSTLGILFSAGAFSTAQPVIANNVLQVSYSVSM